MSDKHFYQQLLRRSMFQTDWSNLEALHHIRTSATHQKIYEPKMLNIQLDFSADIFVLIICSFAMKCFLLTMNSFLSKLEIICQTLCCTSEQVFFNKLTYHQTHKSLKHKCSKGHIYGLETMDGPLK